MNIINAQVEVLKEALKNKNTVIYGELLDNVIIRCQKQRCKDGRS